MELWCRPTMFWRRYPELPRHLNEDSDSQILPTIAAKMPDPSYYLGMVCMLSLTLLLR